MEADLKPSRSSPSVLLAERVGSRESPKAEKNSEKFSCPPTKSLKRAKSSLSGSVFRMKHSMSHLNLEHEDHEIHDVAHVSPHKSYSHCVSSSPVNLNAHSASRVHGHGIERERKGLRKCLTFWQLIPLGVGSTIGAGIYVLIGSAARDKAGPSLPLSFLLAGMASGLSALCYAELASRCPSAGSAYHYAYTTVGEIFAWLIGWSLILEYTVGGSAVARGISPNLEILLGGLAKTSHLSHSLFLSPFLPNSTLNETLPPSALLRSPASSLLPFFLRRFPLPHTDIVLDPIAFLFVVFITLLLCKGVKESALLQQLMTATNVFILCFVTLLGIKIGSENGWPGYTQGESLFPFGVSGMLSASAMVFYSFIGFDALASCAEEVSNPQVDLPLGIGFSLLLCSLLYVGVSAVLVGIVPFDQIDRDTPMAQAFQIYHCEPAVYLVTIGGMAALSTTLMGSILPQPRILMVMSRDGLLPPFFASLSPSLVPLNATLLTGAFAALMAFVMDIEQLSGMVSVGTLLAFSSVSIAVLILRFTPPHETLDRRRRENGRMEGRTEKGASEGGTCLPLGSSANAVESVGEKGREEGERGAEDELRRIRRSRTEGTEEITVSLQDSERGESGVSFALPIPPSMKDSLRQIQERVLSPSLSSPSLFSTLSCSPAVPSKVSALSALIKKVPRGKNSANQRLPVQQVNDEFSSSISPSPAHPLSSVSNLNQFFVSDSPTLPSFSPSPSSLPFVVGSQGETEREPFSGERNGEEEGESEGERGEKQCANEMRKGNAWEDYERREMNGEEKEREDVRKGEWVRRGRRRGWWERERRRIAFLSILSVCYGSLVVSLVTSSSSPAPFPPSSVHLPILPPPLPTSLPASHFSSSPLFSPLPISSSFSKSKSLKGLPREGERKGEKDGGSGGGVRRSLSLKEGQEEERERKNSGWEGLREKQTGRGETEERKLRTTMDVENEVEREGEGGGERTTERDNMSLRYNLRQGAVSKRSPLLSVFSLFLPDNSAFGYLWLLFSLSGILSLVIGWCVLSLFVKEDKRQKRFGQQNGFLCPFVPSIPILSILVNAYLMVNLGLPTWARCSVWMLIGLAVYVLYGYKNSQLGRRREKESGRARRRESAGQSVVYTERGAEEEERERRGEASALLGEKRGGRREGEGERGTREDDVEEGKRERERRETSSSGSSFSSDEEKEEEKREEVKREGAERKKETGREIGPLFSLANSDTSTVPIPISHLSKARRRLSPSSTSSSLLSPSPSYLGPSQTLLPFPRSQNNGNNLSPAPHSELQSPGSVRTTGFFARFNPFFRVIDAERERTGSWWEMPAPLIDQMLPSPVNAYAIHSVATERRRGERGRKREKREGVEERGRGRPRGEN